MIYRGLLAFGLVAGVAAGSVAYRRSGTRSPASRRVDPARLPVNAPAVIAFASELCLACRRTPGIVARALDVGEDELREGKAPVAFEQVDVGERGDLARAFDVRRTPAVAVVDAEGRVPFFVEDNPDPDELAGELAGLVEA